MKIEGDVVIFSSGKKRSANCGIIGLSPSLDVSEGYDGSFYDNPDGEEWREEEDKLSQVDLIELADYMIEQWGKFRDMKMELGKV